MANKKISDLAAGSALDGTERFEAEQPASTTSVYLTGAQIKTWALSSPTITGHATIEGVTATGATGTGKFVFDAAPTLSGHPTIEGVTSTGATGTGRFVFDNTPTLITPVIGAATGTSLSLSTGASNITIAPATANTEPLTVTMGTMTATTKGVDITATFNNAAVAGTPLFVNVTNTSSAAAALMADYQVGGTSRFKLPVNTAARSAIFSEEGSTGFVFQYSAATDNAFILQPNTNAVLFGSTFTSTGAFKPIDFYTGGVAFRLDTSQNFIGTAGSTIGFGTSTTSLNQVSITADTILSRFGTATLQHGAADAASPVAQTIRVQSVVAGTTNTAGTDWTLNGSAGTGTGAGGKIILQTAPAGSTGTAQNALAAALTLTAPAVNMQPSVVVGNQALATNATDGFLYIPTCAGTPSGTPTAFTGRVAMIYDTTNNKFYIYNGAWKGGTSPGAFT